MAATPLKQYIDGLLAPLITAFSNTQQQLQQTFAAFMTTIGAVSSVSTGLGLTGGPITTSGTVAIAAGTYALIESAEQTANKGQPNGYPNLDGTGHIPVAQIPAGVAGGLTSLGAWNAATNTPTLTSTPPTQSGSFYVVTVAGTTSITTRAGAVSTWLPGDILLSDGVDWDKMDGSATQVSMLLGLTGPITLAMLIANGVAPNSNPILNGVTLSDISAGQILATTTSGKMLGLHPSGLSIVNTNTLQAALAGLVDVNLSTPISGDRINYNGSQWVNGRAQYTTGGYFTGGPTASQTIFAHRFAEAAKVPINFGTTTSGGVSAIESFVTATSSTTLTINQCLAANNPTLGSNWFAIGTAVIPAGGYEAAIVTNGGTVVTIAQHDRMEIVGGPTPDATASNFCITLAADQ